VPLSRLTTSPVEVRFALTPGDRPLVAAGEAVDPGAPLAERLRDARTIVVDGPPAGSPEGPGDAWTPTGLRGRDPLPTRTAELLFRSGGHWRIGTGAGIETLETPIGGTVVAVTPGVGIRLRAEATGLRGAEVLAGPSAGRLEIVTGAGGEVRASEINVGAAGAVIVAGARMDAEALTRARAVGVRGVIVASLGMKERRDFLASEKRGRAGAHALPPFSILVLDGALRRPIASAVMAILERLAGRTVAIVADPPCLLFDAGDLELPEPPRGAIRVVSGPLAGAEGTWAGLAGPRRQPDGVVTEAGLVRFGERPAVAVPLGDLERFA